MEELILTSPMIINQAQIEWIAAATNGNFEIIGNTYMEIYACTSHQEIAFLQNTYGDCKLVDFTHCALTADAVLESTDQVMRPDSQSVRGPGLRPCMAN